MHCEEMKVGHLSCVRSGALPREVFTRIACRAGEQWTQNLVQKDRFRFDPSFFRSQGPPI